MSKQARKTLAECINNAKRQAVNNYGGYELIAQVEIITWLQESIVIELLKDYPIQTVENFIQDCTAVENETTDE